MIACITLPLSCGPEAPTSSITLRRLGLDLVAACLLRHIGLQDGHLCCFLIGELFAAGLLELLDALAALFHLLGDHLEHLVVGQLSPL